MRTISTGINAFGAVGLFVGTLILAITVALFTFLREEKRAGTCGPQLLSHPETEALDRITSTHPNTLR